MESQKFSTKLGNKDLIIESGMFAEQASGAVTVRYGDTLVLATCVVGNDPRDGVDFFPLLVDYEERLYAAGKISGSRFIKREGRPSEAATLACRLIDRPLRPLFPKAYRNDVQVVITTLSYDSENDPDVIGIVAASAALMQTHAPFEGPVGAVRVALDEKDNFIVNPTVAELKKSKLDLVVAGTKDKVMMLESAANEVSEELMFKAIEFAHKEMQPSIEIQSQLPKREPVKTQMDEMVEESKKNIEKEVKEFIGDKFKEVARITDKIQRSQQYDRFLKEVLENFEGNYKQIDLRNELDKLMKKELRQAIIEDNHRPDGRKLDEIRPISVIVGLLPRTHGSGLFTRGQTQALSIVTLGGPGEEQLIDTMEEEGEKRYMHHYNFPPYSTGEAKPLRSAGRREIGHGALAEKALRPMIPLKEEFPYTIRVVSEILSSNGSSSMAATCGSTLALMDAGVPIKKPVSGIAMGLITSDDGSEYKILTDLQGLEDFGGDMDFKVAGTADGITAVQLDIKLKGLSFDIIKDTLEKARVGRLSILDKMLSVIPEPRKDLSPYAPRIITVKINPEKIGELIGPGGKNINGIIAVCGGKEILSIDIDEDGTVSIASTDSEMGEKAAEMVRLSMKEVEVGETFMGTVTNIQKDRMSGKEVGAIVQLTPKIDGMVHISQVADQRIEKVSDYLHVGDKIPVVVVDIDRERGRIALSYKAAKK
jgi:polyribonucleotide nucleotidyltransferase